MAELRVPDKHIHLTEGPAVQHFLQERGIWYDHRPAEAAPIGPGDEDILQAHAGWLKPFMDKNGYRTADVIRVTPATPNVPAIRDKFLREHTHSEDEVRFFVDGEGLFWFHKETPEEEVFSVRCTAGDLLTVPANMKHWFDLGESPRVCAIRVFTDQAGWVPRYTRSNIEQRYC
jgi:1,2-dihydroxy-3-keto-5-methylthiopentene dioxygenase